MSSKSNEGGVDLNWANLNSTWEFRKVCTSSPDIMDRLAKLQEPVGVVIFGPQCGEMVNIAFMIRDALANTRIGPNFESLETDLRLGFNVIVIMDGESSCSHKCRHEMFTKLKAAGARTLVGVYVKWATTVHEGSTEQREQFARQVKKLRRNPPTADGIDYLLIVTPEEA